MASTGKLACGAYLLELRCVECGAGVDVLVDLFTRTTIDVGGGTLRAVCKSKPVDHMCGQVRLHDAAGDADPDDQDALPIDWRERAAGPDAR